MVDDSVVMRRMITDVLARHDEIEVAGTASNGKIALQKLPQLTPDLVTLDVEMPEMDGLQTLRELRKVYPRLPVIMFSTLTSRGAVTTLDALAAGASDYVAKPANVGSAGEGISRLERDLVPKIFAHCRRPVFTPLPTLVTKPVAVAPPMRRPGSQRVEVLCIGSSTGGPNALAEVFNALPANLPVPVVVVQHMPPLFTAFLAERLAATSKLPTIEGAEGTVLRAGHCYIAPGGHHMEVVRRGGSVQLHIHDGPPENSCRPAVDVLFRSAAATFGAGTLAAVLTGMGSDGQRGCEVIRESGGWNIAQDEATSVVWGMPGAVATAGLADQILPITEIGAELARRCFIGRAAAPLAMTAA